MSAKSQVEEDCTAEDLTAAAMWGDSQLLEGYLMNNVDPNLLNAQGNTALHVASYYGERECANTLLTFKADVNARGAGGKTPLHRAVAGISVLEPGVKYTSEEQIHENQIDMVKLLVGKGGIVKCKDDDGNTPCDLAIQYDFYECKEVLEELAAIQQHQEELREYEENVEELYAACTEGKLSRVKQLLPLVPEALKKRLKDNVTLLMRAAQKGHVPVIEHLIEEGATIVLTPKTSRSALHFAAEAGHLPAVKCLVYQQPQLLQYDESLDGTSLHLAAKHGHVEIVKFFLDIASNVDSIRTPCKPSNDVLADSSSLDHVSEVPYDSFVNVISASPLDNRTPLHEAVISGHLEVVKVLVAWLKQHPQKRALISPASPSPFSHQPPPSPYSSSTGSSGSGGLRPSSSLVTTGIDAITTMGRTPLHEACRLGNIEASEILLAAGADVNAVMRPAIDVSVNTDLTALVEASLSNRIDIVRFLLRHGATDARLKALTRVLRLPYNDIAGVLLCYNGTCSTDSGGMELRRRAGRETGESPLLLSVSWEGKKLPYVHPDWLTLVLTEAPRPKGALCAISQLNISDNSLHALPISIFQLPHLQRLDAGRNSITTLPVNEDDPGGGWSCPALYYLDLNRNRLSKIPTVVFQIPALKDLTCSYNELVEVPMELWNAPKLQKLCLQHNKLESFPSPVAIQDSGIGTYDFALSVRDPSWSVTGGRESLGGVGGSGGGGAGPGIQSSLSLQELSIMFPSPKARETPPSAALRRHRPSLPLALPTCLSSSLSPGRASFSVSSASSLSDRKSSGASIASSNILPSRIVDFLPGLSIEEDVFNEELDFQTPEKGKGKEMFRLDSLDLSHNHLTVVPAGLCCLAPKLTKLHLHHNNLRSLGSIKDYPADLEVLDASYNQLTTAIACATLRDSFRAHGCMQKLILLPVDERESLTPSRCSHRSHLTLKRLSYLKLSNNNLIDVQLFRTYEKHVGHTELTNSIEDNTPVQSAYVRSQTLDSRPNKDDFFRSSNPPRLRHTDSRNNRSSHRSDSSSGEGSGDGSNVKDPADGAPEVRYCLFPQLSSLDLGYNNLTQVPANIHLISSLAVLTISRNESIETLPLALSNLENLWSLEYEGVPLSHPPAEDLNKFPNTSDKLLYMKALLHDAKPNQSMKLMLVGLQKQGKTTLLAHLKEKNEVRSLATTFNQRIKGEPAPSQSFGSAILRRTSRAEPLSTVGVDLGMWKYRKDMESSYRRPRDGKQPQLVTFYTWDFGGQEEYYATHQCFLSTRSLYLVVWDVTEREEGVDKLEPWLHNIQARAPDSPVVLVGTHCDQIKGVEEKERVKHDLVRYLQNRYMYGQAPQQMRELGLPRIMDIRFVGMPSSGKAEGMTELRTALYDIAFALTTPRKKGLGGGKTKLLEQPIPSSYLRLQERVWEMATSCTKDESPPVIKEAQFRELTSDIIANPRELDQGVTFLHENGIMLHYATPALKHLYFIDPQWLCDMLAHVVTVPEVNRFIQRGAGPDAGILRTSVLSHVFKGKLFPQAHRKEYIELLGKFEVALLLDRNRLLVPSMLPPSPRYTLHRSHCCCPRPSLRTILKQQNDPQTSEDQSAPHSPTKDTFTIPHPLISPSLPPSPPLHRTGLLLRRFYFMTYVPSGFWPRLISRFLTSIEFPRIVLTSLGYSEESIQQISGLLKSGDSCTMISLEWSYWTSGIELWYQTHSLLRVSDIRPEGSFHNCSSSPSGYTLAATSPIEPAEDTRELSFQLKGQWMAVDQTPNSGVEIVIPDYVCLPVLERQYRKNSGSNAPLPHRESSWMSAQLLALAVLQLDTLLEDWYPGIGDGNQSLYSIPYINRIIPCPFCVSKAEPSASESGEESEEMAMADVASPSLLPISEEKAETSSKTRRDLMPSFAEARDARGGSSGTFEKDEVTLTEASLSPYDSSCSVVAMNSFGSPLKPTNALMQASKFGFMIESLVMATRSKSNLVCPLHQDYPLTVVDLAPDLVFADLPTYLIINPLCLDQGKFVASGSFGDIFYGHVFPTPSASDDEGREVAIKMDKADKRKLTKDSAAKAYKEVRAEVAVLKNLHHSHVIEFIGLVLNPLCFVLEWAPLGSLHTILKAYSKADARVSPWTLQETTRQVACGLAYLHSCNIVYYDLKSPNILAFDFPTAEQSIDVALGYSQRSLSDIPVHVKIADLGIARILTPGGVVGFKGTPAFMAPEILQYVGQEACTEKVDVFSFGMFMYELITLSFPFERQNLMHNQIERLVVEGERPPLQTRELKNPIQYLDIMQWAWQQDYHLRPSASQLETVLSIPTVAHLINAYPLQSFCQPEVTAACVVTLPIDISTSASKDEEAGEKDVAGPVMAPGHSPAVHPYFTEGDLQEEVWLSSQTSNQDGGAISTLSAISFRGRANFSVECHNVSDSKVTCMCSVSVCVWVGTEKGEVVVFDGMTRTVLYRRILAIHSGQEIVYIGHAVHLRQVVVVRSDGYIMLFDDTLSGQNLPDASLFDNHINATLLPVKSVFRTLRNHRLFCAQMTVDEVNQSAVLWLGTVNELLFAVDMTASLLQFNKKLYHRPYSNTSISDVISQICVMERESEKNKKRRTYLWTLTHPNRMLYHWDAKTMKVLSSYVCDQYTPLPVTSMLAIDKHLFLGCRGGKVVILGVDPSNQASLVCELSGHTKSVSALLSLGSRVLPRHWIPSIIGRSNVIEYYRELLGEDDIETITSHMIGRQCRMLLSVGQGMQGLAGRPMDSSLVHKDHQDSFLLLWFPPR